MPGRRFSIISSASTRKSATISARPNRWPRLIDREIDGGDGEENVPHRLYLDSSGCRRNAGRKGNRLAAVIRRAGGERVGIGITAIGGERDFHIRGVDGR